MKFLRMFLGRHLAGKPEVASQNVRFFLRLLPRKPLLIRYRGSFLVISLKRTSLTLELYIVFRRFPRLFVSLFVGGYSLPSLSRLLRSLNFIYHTSCLDGMMTRMGYVWSIKRSGGFHCWVIIININFSILAPRKLVLLYSSPSPGRTSSRNLHNEGNEIIHHR